MMLNHTHEQSQEEQPIITYNEDPETQALTECEQIDNTQEEVTID